MSLFLTNILNAINEEAYREGTQACESLRTECDPLLGLPQCIHVQMHSVRPVR